MDEEKARAVAQQFGRGRSTRDDLFKAFLRLGQYVDDMLPQDGPVGKLREKLQSVPRRPSIAEHGRAIDEALRKAKERKPTE